MAARGHSADLADSAKEEIERISFRAAVDRQAARYSAGPADGAAPGARAGRSLHLHWHLKMVVSTV